MSYITIAYSPPPAFGSPYGAATEKTLATWGITACTRDSQNLSHDSVGLNVSTSAIGPDVFTYGGQITIYLGRIGSAFGKDGQPTVFSGGVPWYRGWRRRNLRVASGRMQAMQYKFAGVFENILEFHVFQKFVMQWNGIQGSGAGLVMQPASQIWLGQSIATLTQQNGQQTTNMTIAQQVAEIVQYTIAQTICEYSGGPGGKTMPITIPLNQGTNADVVIANFITSNQGSQLFALDNMFATDQNFNVVGTAGKLSPLNGNNIDGGWAGLCPMDSANDLTCAEALKKTLKFMPGVSMWFDFSPTIGAPSTSPIPVLHIATKDYLTTIGNTATLPWGNSNTSEPYGHRTSKIDRRDDLIPPCVDYKYKVTTTSNGQEFIAFYDDVACAAGQTGSTGTPAQPGSPTVQLSGGSLIYAATNPTGYNAAVTSLLPQTQRLGAEVATFDFNGGSSTSTTLNTLPIPYDIFPDTPIEASSLWRTVLCTALNDPSITDLQGASIPNVLLTLTDGVTVANGAYRYFIVGGPIASGWVDIGNPTLPQGIQMTLSATVSYTENTTLSDGSITPSNKPNERKSVSIYAFTAPSGTFGTVTSVAEPIPFGLAAYVYNIESIPQYDGSHGIVESDPETGLPTITDACPLGTNLNIMIPPSAVGYSASESAGIVAEYASMNAQVQTVSYDMMAGRTDITFGVPTHLGGKELIERLRINRGPRWLYEIGPSLINNGGNNGSVSGTTQLKDSQAAVKTSNLLWMPAGTTGDGSQVAPGYITGAPGATTDTRTAGQPSYGGVPPPSQNAPVQFLATGASGNLISFSYNSGAGVLIVQQGSGTGTQSVRISVADLFGATAFTGLLRLREYACCYDFGDGNGPVAAFVVLLGSVPYKISLGVPLAGPWTV